MDYVVFGMGYGATLMLLGWVLRTFGPGLRYRADDDAPPLSGKHLLARTSWRRFAAGLGAVIATAGLVLVLITFVLILVHPTEDVGVLTVLLVVAASLIAVAAWLWLYVGRYGTYGLLAERKPAEPAPAPVPAGARPLLPAKAEGAEASPAVAMTSGTEVTAPDAAGPALDIEPDPYAFGPTDLDESERAELEIRMSRYHVHHPEPEAEIVTDDAEVHEPVSAVEAAPAADGEIAADDEDGHAQDDVVAMTDVSGADAPDDASGDPVTAHAGEVNARVEAESLDTPDGGRGDESDTTPAAGSAASSDSSEDATPGDGDEASTDNGNPAPSAG